ncbi:MAG: rod shape-determining protein MreC [Terriglobales bacterium]
METLISRYRNVSVLVAVLFAKVLLLGVQVKRSEENRSTRLIRVWAVDGITPFEKAIVRLQSGTVGLWHEYFYLRGVRQENRELKQQIERMQLDQVRLNNDAEQSRRLQALMGFKEQFISHTVAAQVIGSSGSERSRVIYIDKVGADGIGKDMPVITADGVVGKVLNVFRSSAQVLLIDDQTSGVGTILEQSRLQGVLEGTPDGEIILDKIMNDEQVQPGEKVLTSGGDGIFPKGLLVGTVENVARGPESFLSIKVKPAADLGRLEEVLVITQREERVPDVAGTNSRAVDILAQRLPSVPDKPPAAADGKNGDQKNQSAAIPATQAQPSAQVAATPTSGSTKPPISGSIPVATNSGAKVAGKNPVPAKALSPGETAPDSFSSVKSPSPTGNPVAQKKISRPIKPATIQPQPQTAPASPQDQPQ